MKFNTRIFRNFFRNSCPWAMTNEYQNVVALKIIFCENCRMPQSHDCSLWNHNLEHFRGRKRKMNLSWWTKIGFEKKSWFLAWKMKLDLKESEQMMMICFCSIVSVCQFVKSNEHLRQLFPCLCQFSTLMFPPCCAIGNHWKVSNDVHPTTFCLNFYLHLLQRNSALQRKSGTELKN